MSEAPKRIVEVAKKYKFHGLYIKNFIVSALLIVLPLIGLNVLLYSSMRKLAIDEASALSLNTLQKTRDVFDSIFKQGEYLAASVALQSDTEVYVLTDQYDAIWTRNAVQSISANLKTIVYSNDFIHTVYLFSEVSDRVITHVGENDRKSFLDSGWYDTYLDIDENRIYKVFRNINDNYPNVISLIKPLYLLGPDKKLGAIVINFDVDQLKPVLLDRDLSSPEELYAIDSDGTILFSASTEELGKTASGEQLAFISVSQDYSTLEKSMGSVPRIVSVSLSGRYPWYFLSYHALSNYTLQSSRLQGFMALAIFVSLVSTVVAAFLISANSYRPIKRILGALQHPEQTQLLQKSGGGRLSNETKFIATAIARFAHTNQELSAELNKQLSRLDSARLAALQTQINPHFLNNTLEVISMSARRLSPGDNQVVSMISLLSRLLRIALDTEHNIVPLSEEVEYANLYLEILAIRYQDRFEVTWNIDDRLIHIGVLKLCLQPLLENAFYHGIKPTRGKGKISIDITEAEREMVLKVTNTGKGIPPQTIKMLNRTLSAEFEISGDHVGMRNVNQRTKLLFGDKFGVSISSSRAAGTAVTLRTPIVSQPE
ncbi:MAG: histidine kinase [Spirochaetales bacterium]|jgi:two-component system, sensor histidine kinase YesM|nr:histidine kinase [Spirochaetales bacterium]